MAYRDHDSLKPSIINDLLPVSREFEAAQAGHRYRSHDDKRGLVRSVLSDPDRSTWSGRQIARHCGVSPDLVRRVQQHLASRKESEGAAPAPVAGIVEDAGFAVAPTARDSTTTVEPLTASTPPGGGAPTFEPVASAPAQVASSTPEADLLALGREFEAAWAAERAHFSATPPGEDHPDDVVFIDCVSRIVDRIKPIPATTPVGLLVKVRALLWCKDVYPGESRPDAQSGEERLMASIVRDSQAIIEADGFDPAQHGADAPDAVLLGLAEQFQTRERCIRDLCARHPGVTCNDMPGYSALDRQQFEAVERVAAVPSRTVAGLVAKARMAGVLDVEARLGMSLAADVLAVLAGPAAPAGHPDAALLALHRRYDELLAAERTAYAHECRVWNLVEAAMPPAPDALRIATNPGLARGPEELRMQNGISALYIPGVIERFRTVPRTMMVHYEDSAVLFGSTIHRVPDPEGQERAEAAVAAYDVRMAERHRLEEQFGQAEATRRANEVGQEVTAVADQIAAAPVPRTLLGFAVKARVALRRDESDMYNVLRELLAASGLVDAAPELDQQEADEAAAAAEHERARTAA